MSTATPPMTSEAPAPLEMPVPVAGVPSLEEIRRLTEVPDRRVVFRGVDWDFYEELVDSIPEYVHIHVDYDGKDLEILSKGIRHERARKLLDWIVGATADEFEIRCQGAGQTTWKRREVSRGLEADESYYFSAEKIAQDVAALERGSDNVADYPNPDLAIEVDISPPQVDRAGIYAALRVPEVWRFDGDQLVIERLTPQGTYAAVDSSGFLPLRADEVRHWVVEKKAGDDMNRMRQLRAEIRRKRDEVGRAFQPDSDRTGSRSGFPA
jgi:Uma2 family endonuclease